METRFVADKDIKQILLALLTESKDGPVEIKLDDKYGNAITFVFEQSEFPELDDGNFSLFPELL